MKYWADKEKIQLEKYIITLSTYSTEAYFNSKNRKTSKIKE